MGVFRLEGNKVNALPVSSGRVFHPGDHAGRLLVPRILASGLVLDVSQGHLAHVMRQTFYG